MDYKKFILLTKLVRSDKCLTLNFIFKKSVKNNQKPTSNQNHRFFVSLRIDVVPWCMVVINILLLKQYIIVFDTN